MFNTRLIDNSLAFQCRLERNNHKKIRKITSGVNRILISHPDLDATRTLIQITFCNNDDQYSHEWAIDTDSYKICHTNLCPQFVIERIFTKYNDNEYGGSNVYTISFFRDKLNGDNLTGHTHMFLKRANNEIIWLRQNIFRN